MKGLYKTEGVCSAYIGVELDGDIIKRVEFMGGGQGNLQAVARLVQGMHVDEAVQRLKGIDCGGRGTSCPDQLSKALLEVKEKGMAEEA